MPASAHFWTGFLDTAGANRVNNVKNKSFTTGLTGKRSEKHSRDDSSRRAETWDGYTRTRKPAEHKMNEASRAKQS